MSLFSKRRGLLVAGFLLFSAVVWVGVTGLQEQLSAGTDKTYEELKIFSDVLDIVEKNYVDPVDSKELIQGAIQGMLESLDPHSSFLLPEAYKELQIDTKGEFSGIGIVITMEDNIVTVISPIEGSPAHTAGVLAGDHIVAVDGEPTKDMKLWEAVKKMRGKQGTSVVITVKRKDVEDPIDFTIVRNVIPLESVRAYELKPGYGYLRVTNFRDNTYNEVVEAIEKLEAANKAAPIEGMVFDLRDNPGGLLDQAVKIADVFLDKGKIVSIEGRQQTHSKTYYAHADEKKHSYPIVVLINEGSASASEIVAGALQDHGRALILGDTSFGKGSVQTVEPLRDGSGLKLTIARYYTPNGNAIQAKGIKPDVVVKERLAREPAEEPAGHVKEKDLKNHIEAKPNEPDSDQAQEEMKLIRSLTLSREPGEVVNTLLTKDNQVRRALEILASWQVFSRMPM